MDRRAWETVVEKEVVDKVRTLLIVDKDDCASRWHGQQQIKQTVSLFVLINEYDLEQD